MKALFFTDSQLCSRLPIRKDQFGESILQKILTFSTEAMTRGIDLIICGGDLFNHARIAPSIVAKLANIIHTCEIPWVVIPGQHDIEGHLWETYKDSSMGILHAAMPERFTVLPNGWNGEVYKFDDTRIVGFPYLHDGELYLNEALRKVSGRADIAIVHAMVVDAEKPFNYILAKELDGAIPYLLCGDYHPGLWYSSTQGYIVNPGALARVSRREVGRIPSVAFLDTDKGFVTLIPIPVTTDVWVDERELKAFFDEETMNRLVNDFGHIGYNDVVTGSGNLITLIEQVAKDSRIENSVVQKALEALKRQE